MTSAARGGRRRSLRHLWRTLASAWQTSLVKRLSASPTEVVRGRNFSRSWTNDAGTGRFPGSRFFAAGLPSRSLTSGFVDPVLTAYSCGYSQGCAVARLVPFLTPNGAGTEANAQGSVGESQAGFQAQNTVIAG